MYSLVRLFDAPYIWYLVMVSRFHCYGFTVFTVFTHRL